jgi:ABC-type Fe3+/spermidine/putrescine transport system ATPase subunit
MSYLRIDELRKSFGAIAAVDGIGLEIAEGEFFTFLGSSGCGKTTTLRLIGGLEKPDAGSIHVGARCVAAPQRRIFVKPEKRDMGMVFQSYALWPHMTVFENVSYPLRLRRIKGRAAESKVAEVLALVGLAGLEDRPAPSLSGGQQQRVALARALVFSPKVLLLDEPLSNLDAQLREEMRRELKALQRRINITVVFVTHDQVEALSLSDRIAIMRYGRIEQVGTPQAVYDHPATPFVRDFLGKTLLLPGKIAAVSHETVRVEASAAGAGMLAVGAKNVMAGADGFPAVGQAALLAIRPEKVALSSAAAENGGNRIRGILQASQFLGDRYEHTVTVGSETRVLVSPDAHKLEPGSEIWLELKPEAMTLWPVKD